MPHAANNTQNESKAKSFQNIKSGYYSTIYKGGNVTNIETETSNKNVEVRNPFSSYQIQKKTIAEHNRLAVQNYNAKYNQ